MEFYSKLYLTGSQCGRVIDRRRRSESRSSSVTRVIRQHAGREIDGGDVCSIYGGYIRAIKDVESFCKQFKSHSLGESDPFRDTQVGRRNVRALINVAQERNTDYSARTEQSV